MILSKDNTVSNKYSPKRAAPAQLHTSAVYLCVCSCRVLQRLFHITIAKVSAQERFVLYYCKKQCVQQRISCLLFFLLLIDF